MSAARLVVVPPRTRGDCVDGPRPCPFGGCRYHLGHGGDESCALDVAARGEHTLDEVGKLLGVTRERIRQIETAALRRLRRGLIAAQVIARADVANMDATRARALGRVQRAARRRPANR